MSDNPANNPMPRTLGASSLSTRGPELSVIVPTFNERENVLELIQRLQISLVEYCWEVIFVDDDSP